jgi:outer membrane protein OmpA-like peptidoglycan-associated protein
MASVRWVWLVAAFGIAGCAGPVTAYHDIEGGAIAQPRQPPPGANLPYPNLASVPAAPVALTPAQTQNVTQRLNPAAAATQATQANPAALAGLALPGGVPPAPNVGLNIPSLPTPAPGPAAPPAAPVPARPADRAAVSLAFAPGSAIISSKTAQALAALAQTRGGATILAGGFGEQADAPDATSLILALNRARAIADALTAAGVPPAAIILSAAAAGSGGFVQFIY